MVAIWMVTITYVYPPVQFLTQEYHALSTIYIYIHILNIYKYIYIYNYITCSVHHSLVSYCFLSMYNVFLYPIIHKTRLYGSINCLNGREWLWPAGQLATSVYGPWPTSELSR